MSEEAQGGQPHELTVNNHRFYCRVAGAADGTPLVLVTGVGQPLAHWPRPFLADLERTFPLVRYDGREIGFTADLNDPAAEGGAARAPGVTPVREHAADLLGIIEALGYRRVYLLGWGLGAAIALEAARAAQHRVRALVLMGGLAEPGRYPPVEAVRTALGDFSGSPEEIRERRAALMFPPAWWAAHREDFFAMLGDAVPRHRCQPAAITVQQAALEAWPGLRGELPGINAPALVIAGMEDALVPPRNATFLADNLHDGRLVLIDNAGHGLMYQYPHRLAGRVTGFLTEEL